MTEVNPSARSVVQVDGALYTSAKYCIPGRFSAYAYQISEILDSGPERVLEIGPGNGVVSYVLRKAGIRVDTLDHDPELDVDFIGSVLDMPFPADSYDSVLCCQVLEHLPWGQFHAAMKEIARVARANIVISVPQISRHYFLNFKLPKIGERNFEWDRPLHLEMKFDGQHYWEIGKGVDEGQLLSVFRDLNLTVVKSYRVPEFRYHHFFCLSKDSRH